MSASYFQSAPELQLRYWREVWRRLALQSGDRPIAIYGAGHHTVRLLSSLVGFDAGPRIGVIIDDTPRIETLNGIPVRTPADANPVDYAAIVVSSDTIEELLLGRATDWASRAPLAERPAIERLYENLSEDNADFAWDGLGDRRRIVRRGFDGDRREVIDQWGNAELQEPAVRPNRPDAAVEPVHHWILRMETPEYTVRFRPIKREVSALFKPSQIYPGSMYRGGSDMFSENFVTRSEPGLITPDTRVSVVGSCFASTFRNWLIYHDYNFMQFEDGPLAHCGSVRTGPVFNSGILRQIFDWSANGFDAAEPYWHLDDKLYDPYRKYICWDDERSAEAERADHFHAVRTMLVESDVLIITLGLSEVWRNAADKSCFYLLPPTDVYDSSRHEHAMLSAEENLHNLERSYEIIRAANPDLRLVVTLSPVPLLATYFDRSVVVSDTVSKASLRTALHFFCENHPEVIYFPSYEMLMRRPEWPFAQDNRHIRSRPYGKRIMETFIAAYGAPRESLVEPKAAAGPSRVRDEPPAYYDWAARSGDPAP